MSESGDRRGERRLGERPDFEEWANDVVAKLDERRRESSPPRGRGVVARLRRLVDPRRLVGPRRRLALKTVD